MNTGESIRSGTAFKTSLGPTVEYRTGLWVLDLTVLPLFHGLSVISRSLGEIIIDQAGSDRIDINVERTIRPRENPELLHHLGVTLVKVWADHDAVRTLVQNPELFQDNLRAIFGTLQRNLYRNVIFPVEEGKPSKNLVFHFSFPSGGDLRRFIFMLERVQSPRNRGQCSLRITIEDPLRPRLALDAIPHRVVEDMESRTFIAGSTRIAETWTEGLRREAERNRRSFIENDRPHSHLFKQLRKAGLDTVEKITLTWSDIFVNRILGSDPAEVSHLLKRVLLTLEDQGIRRLLRSGETLRVVCDDVSVYVDQSQLGRALTISLGGRRERFDLDVFLDRMPVTAHLVENAPPGVFSDMHIFLIHHITAEVLGLIAALRRLGCRDITTLFVAYAGEVPGQYLGPLLEVPPRELRSLALMNVPDEETVEGRYILSTRYSNLEKEEELKTILAQGRMRFFEAMKAVAAFEFMEQVQRAEVSGGRCLIIEDGGYLMPAVNRACLEGKTVSDFLGRQVPDREGDRPLQSVVEPLLIGSVEHTRNGMDRLLEVESRHGCLAFPAFTIAASRHKAEVEAREVAVTLLNAVENVLHATGKILSRRSCLVLGSRGAIGGFLMRFLGERLNQPEAQLLGVDLKAGEERAAGLVNCPESVRCSDLPPSRRRGVDLVMGVTGESVLTGADLEAWLLEGDPVQIIFASGSTKTEEYRDLADWMDVLLRADAPRLRGCPVHITTGEVKDPLTGRFHGHRYEFAIEGGTGIRRREVVFLANLTPVNFMFYGVPTEVIDEVMAELLGCGLGLSRRAKEEDLPCRLHGVDQDITPMGEPLCPPRPPTG